MTTKHTPGPWSFQNIEGKPRHLFRIAASDNTFIAESDSTRTDGEANGILIAAAPDLLAALEKCVAQLDILLPVTGLVHDERQAMINARAAIARAKGEA